MCVVSVMNMCQGNSQANADHNNPEWDINDNHIPKVSTVYIWLKLCKSY